MGKEAKLYCDFLKAHGQNTNQYKSLQNEIEKLIMVGHLGGYIKHERQGKKRQGQKIESQTQIFEGLIRIISRGTPGKKASYPTRVLSVMLYI